MNSRRPADQLVVKSAADLPDPHPGPGQVRIAVRAAGVNPSDWKKREGLMDPVLPQTMGHEAAGLVDEQLGVADGSTLLINGASGSVGSAAATPGARCTCSTRSVS